MTTYMEYLMEDGSSVLIETGEVVSDTAKAARRGEAVVVQTGKKFSDALASARGSLKALIDEMGALQVEEAEIKFGLKATGEAGIFAVGKVAGETSYEITLKWKKPA